MTTDAVERRRSWIAAVDANDADESASLVTDDVVWLPPHGDPLQGRASFRRWIEPVMAAFRSTLTLAPTVSGEAGDRAYETGAFRSVITPHGGGADLEHDGHYFVLWRIEADDVWRIERYVDLAVPIGGAREP